MSRLFRVTISERKRAERGQERLNVRLGRGYKERLRELAERAGLSVSKWIEAVADEKYEGQRR